MDDSVVGHVVESHDELGNDAEAGSVPAHATEKLRVFGPVHADDLSRCGDHLVADDVVDDRPQPTAQVAETASQRDTCESRMGDRTRDTNQVVEGSLIDVAPIDRKSITCGAGLTRSLTRPSSGHRP